LFWALVAYNVESSEMESKMPRMPWGNYYGWFFNWNRNKSYSRQRY
jgi:hypothetical protein